MKRSDCLLVYGSTTKGYIRMSNLIRVKNSISRLRRAASKSIVTLIRAQRVECLK